ncbi:hypothetical protein [Litchfieldia salsa]|uniref:Uncharacterized protein n=1 Tax=Litchfieldia salsa TaxID=930152 RepID=A0A1H0PJR6_9BACI|nr:hypothetical protein [Litchfieldia salsa]SDP05254.1 hypothetical protein SAMN05216565_101348 [Litchfieldia salsa]
MKHNNKIDWTKFEESFSNFNPYQFGEDFHAKDRQSFLHELMKGNLYVHSQEKEDSYLVDIELPDSIDYNHIHYKVTTTTKPSGKKYKNLTIVIPKK